MSWLARLLARLWPPPPRIEPGEDVVFVDVRTGPEYRRGHAAGAIHIPVSQIAERADELAPHRDRRILVYCLSGHRAGHAVNALRERGLGGAENAGGISGLRRAGVGVVKGEEG